MLCLCVFFMLYLHVICRDWCVKPSTDGEHCKALFSVSNSLSAQLKANSICSIWYVPHTPYYSPSNSVNVWKGATISRNILGIFGVGGGEVEQEACQNSKWRCGMWSCRQLWIRQERPSDPDLQAVTDVDTLRIQLVIVMLAFKPPMSPHHAWSLERT